MRILSDDLFVIRVTIVDNNFSYYPLFMESYQDAITYMDKTRTDGLLLLLMNKQDIRINELPLTDDRLKEAKEIHYKFNPFIRPVKESKPELELLFGEDNTVDTTTIPCSIVVG